MSITGEQIELINGSLLGDGCLSPRKNRKNTRFSILRKLGDLEYLKWQYNFVEDLCLTGIKNKENFDKRTNKTYYSCYFCTVANDDLTKISNKWYNNGKKVIPNDLILTPLILGVWFLDDANIKFTSSEKAIRITFSTQSFSKEDVYFLQNLLQDKFCEYFGVYKNNNGYVIGCSTNPAKKILGYIKDFIPYEVLPRKTSYYDLIK